MHPVVCFRYEKVKSVGGYKNLKRHQDLELWLRCASKGLRFANIKKPLLIYSPPNKKQNIKDLSLNIRIIWEYYNLLDFSFIKFTLFTLIIIFKELMPIKIKFFLRRFFLSFKNNEIQY